MPADHVDVLIIGAGISGIGAACHLMRECPAKTFAVLERRQAIGGTWDLFRYPGVRSDSDMYTFGYNFRPWNDTKVLADGQSIREYVRDTAAEYNVTDKIRFGAKVTAARFSSADALWMVDILDEATGATSQMTAGFLLGCTGYYNYDEGYRPEFPGEESFQGQLVHPQHWPEDLDYEGKKVVIIGSGATAVTLVPAMADDAASVTMLQRSPTYIVAVPARDKISAALRKVLPEGVVYKLARGRNIAIQRTMYSLAQARPSLVKKLIRKGAEKGLAGSADLQHFTPSYEPWDQRLCVIPDGDLFRTLREGKASIVTDKIKTFTATGIDLESGQHLDADIIVTATGLQVQMLGGTHVEIDGETLALRERGTYKGVLATGVPNAAIVFGYVNASWTLKADLAAEYVCRLLNHMDAHGYTTVRADPAPGDLTEGSVLAALNSGYVKRGDAHLPRQGKSGPWRVTNNYLVDVPMLRRGGIDDGILRFGTARAAAADDPVKATA